MEESRFEVWKKRLAKIADDYSISQDTRTDDISARRIGLLVAEEFGRTFDGYGEINILAATMSALQTKVYYMIWQRLQSSHAIPLSGRSHQAHGKGQRDNGWTGT